ncbi:DUF2637 domain-containing protein [Streptacidiphilus sp. MAP5-3]|uniref:DUF2637 domain-containing protein n=1 Tax=unclassified Streptacidiphilus TaxID=2643834 RepID=UPI00351726D5
MKRTLARRVDAVLIQALIAAALSFAHLHDVAQAAGQQGWKAWAYPVSVDLLLVAAWRRLRANRAAGRPVRLGWVWFLIALTASLGANVATAGLLNLNAVPAWLRILVAGWPAAAFLGGTLLAHTGTPATAPVPETEPDSVYLPDPTPAPAPADSTPAVAIPAVSAVPAPLLAHAQRIANEHHRTTGHRIDTSTLRARLGVPAPLAAAITAQLA